MRIPDLGVCANHESTAAQRPWIAAPDAGAKHAHPWVASKINLTTPPAMIRKSGANLPNVTQLRINEAAQLLGVSDDTVRRLVDSGRLAARKDESGRTVVAGADVAAYAREQARAAPDPIEVRSSARNRLVGLVTEVKRDGVMAQVEMQCGPFRIVSLMSSEAADDLGLEPGAVAVAVVKSTTVIVER